MKKKSDPTRLLILAVTLGGAVALVGALLAFPPVFDPAKTKLYLILLVLTAAAERIGIRLKHGDSSELLTLFELAVVADIVLLQPSIALLISIGGLAISLIIQRRPFVKFVFNLGQYSLGVVPAVAIYHSIGHGDFTTDIGLLSLAAGMAVFTLLNLMTISAIIAATTGRPLAKVFNEERDLSIALGIGNSAVGIVAVSLYLTRPVLLPAVLAPTIALHVAFRGWVKQKELTALMEAESTKLGRIVEHATEGIVLADADGSVLLWSPSMVRTTGVPAEEAVGKSISFLLRGRDPFGRSRAIEAGSGIEPIDLEIIAADGSVRMLRVQHGPANDPQGNLAFDVIMVTDVTREREVERLKDDFFSTVSHELRTPLTPIKGYATLLLRRNDDVPADRRREALQAIVDRADHMGRLVEDMLLASRMSSSTERRLPDVSREAVALAPVIERGVRPFELAHSTREFVREVDEKARAMGDPLRVEQIVASLVSNAVKFSEEASDVAVRAWVDGDEVVMTVTDEGRGIPADKVEEVFEKFKRLENPLRMETGGAGLGLFIVRQLAQAMGGTVSVESELGSGSTFTVRLPVAGNSDTGAGYRPTSGYNPERRRDQTA